jgi:hypothetical protein
MDASSKRRLFGQRKDDRVFQGESHWAAKVTEADVIDIRRRYAQGERVSALAREFGLTRGPLRAIAKGLSWRHVPMPSLARLEGP